jgi:hypothetical protein
VKKYEKIDAGKLYHLKESDTYPANTFLHFSFEDYYDPNNMNFGALRVINDTVIKPNNGFGTHPHINMEILSYIVDGQLTHKDSAGNHEVLGRGCVQIISAGAGVTHSELNEQNESCRFLQIWIKPERKDLPVRYDLHKYTADERRNKILNIACSSKDKGDAPLYVCQDFNAYVSELDDRAAKVTFELKKGRQAYILCFEGEVNIDNFPELKERDSLKVFGENSLVFSLSSERAHFAIFEMAENK